MAKDEFDHRAEFLIDREYVPKTVDVDILANKLREFAQISTELKNTREGVYGKELAAEIHARMEDIPDEEKRLLPAYESEATKDSNKP